MLKKIITSAIATSMALAIVGCGGGDSTSPVTSTTTATTEDTTNTGTSQYLDSAVSGITYQCGDQNGITDTNGTFTFEFGQDCTFSLGTIPLRGVSAKVLIDGVPLVEDNITVARVLQSLDFDGDPTNGITIRPEVITVCEEVLSQSGTTELPTTDALLEVLITEVQNNVTEFEGDVVTEEEAQAHLEETLTEVTKTFLAGKKFYTTAEYLDSTAPDYGIVTFNDNVDTVTWEDLDGNNPENGSSSITVEGDKIVWLDGSYTVLTEYTNDYIVLTDYRTDGTQEGTHRLYQDEAKARAYYDTLNSDPLANGFTTEYLNGKTLYFVQYDDFGYDDEGEAGMQWNMARMDFTDSTIAWTEYDTPDTATHTFNYSITSNGEISIDEEHFGEIKLESQTDDYLKVCQDDDCNTYLFFDEAKAKAFKDQKNRSTSYYMLQEGDIAAHAILVGDPSKDKEYAADHTFTSLEENVDDRDGGTWSIEDGKLKHVWSNGNVEIHSFAAQPAVGATITNETYGVSGSITGYYSID
jgi:hypothetical protein